MLICYKMKKFYIIITSISYRQIALFLLISIISAIILIFFNKTRLFGRSDMLHSSSCTAISRLLSQKSGYLLNNKVISYVSPSPVRWLGHCDRRHWVVVQLFGGLGNQLYALPALKTYSIVPISFNILKFLWITMWRFQFTSSVGLATSSDRCLAIIADNPQSTQLFRVFPRALQYPTAILPLSTVPKDLFLLYENRALGISNSIF